MPLDVDSLSIEEIEEFEALINKRKQEKIEADLASKGLRSLTSYAPYPIQEEFHRSDAAFRFFLGGNYTGKTIAGAAECAWWLTKTHPYHGFINNSPHPVDGICIVVDHNLQSLPGGSEAKLLSLLPEDQIKSIHRVDGHVKKITMVNKSTLTFISERAGRAVLQSTRVHFAWLDEESVSSPSYWNEIITRQPDFFPKLYVWGTQTPNLKGGVTFFQTDIYPKCNKIGTDYRSWEATLFDNPYITKEAREAILGGLIGSEEEKRARIKGDWRSRKGQIYNFQDEHHIIPPLNTQTMEQIRVVYRVYDPHPSKPIAVAFFGITHDSRVILFDELYDQGIVKEVADKVHERSKPFAHKIEGDIIDWSANAKSKNDGKSISDLFVNEGIMVRNCKKDVKGGIELVKRALYYKIPRKGQSLLEEDEKPQFLVCSNCIKTIAEFKNYCWNNLATGPIKEFDEFMDCIRYLFCDPEARVLIDGYKTPDGFDFGNIEESTRATTRKSTDAIKRLGQLGRGTGRRIIK